MNYTFQDYEDLVLARLMVLKAPIGQLAELKGFAGEIVLTDAGLLAVLLNRFPAVLMEISEATYTPGPHPFRTEEVTVQLHVCSRSLRSQDEARGGQDGAYAILHAARNLLLGWKLAETLLPLEAVAFTKAASGLTEANEYIVIYQAKYRFTNPRIREE